MVRKVHFALPQDWRGEGETRLLQTMQTELAAGKAPFEVEDDPQRADLIVLLESPSYKTVAYIDTLLGDPLLRDYAARIYTINFDDHPEGMLPGLYSSIEKKHFDPSQHLIWPALSSPNPLIYQLKEDRIFQRKPKKLFSFIGFPSHPLRRRLFSLYQSSNETWSVEGTDKWYNHMPGDYQRFLTVSLDSAFCLCPRGYTAYTHRIAEVMAMGRVPVIIADDWIPFSFGDKRQYYIRIAERDIPLMTEKLMSQRDSAEEIGRNGRAIWERFCSMTNRTSAAISAISGLSALGRSSNSYQYYRSRWRSKAFLRRCGWTYRQRMALRVRQRFGIRKHSERAPL